MNIKYLFVGGPWDGQRWKVADGTDQFDVVLPGKVAAIRPDIVSVDLEPEFMTYERCTTINGGTEFFKPSTDDVKDVLEKLLRGYDANKK